MRSMRLFATCFQPLSVILLCLAAQAAAAADLFLTDVRAFPGQLWLSRSGGVERSIYRREAAANPAFPRAATRLAQVAVGPDGKIYFASGLDGYVLHVLARRNEVVSFEFDGQVRDLACGDEEHTVYFSVVPTPQNGEPLADGKIYRRDIWAGQPSEFATIRQSQIGGGWWGTFAIAGDVVYLATFESPSRIFKFTGGEAEQVAVAGVRIHGLDVGPDRSFYFTDGTDKVYRTSDFQNVETVLNAERSLTDVALDRPAVTDPATP